MPDRRVFTVAAWDDYVYWQGQDRKTLRRINTLIQDTTQTRHEAVINGVLDVRNFTINEGSSLTVLGPNALKIFASGRVLINGSLILRGTNNHGVATLGTTCQPETGATGNAGGGKVSARFKGPIAAEKEVCKASKRMDIAVGSKCAA